MVVAFSCKKRGPCCASCSARRMYNGAAHIVDHVIPDVPVRQYVLSVPFELRLLLAARADAFSAMMSLLVEQVFRWQRERAKEAGLVDVQSGAVVAQHRSGASLNLNRCARYLALLPLRFRRTFSGTARAGLATYPPARVVPFASDAQ